MTSTGTGSAVRMTGSAVGASGSIYGGSGSFDGVEGMVIMLLFSLFVVADSLFSLFSRTS